MENKELNRKPRDLDNRPNIICFDDVEDDDYHALIARGLCPKCVASLRRESGCLSCPTCGWSAC